VKVNAALACELGWQPHAVALFSAVLGAVRAGRLPVLMNLLNPRLVQLDNSGARRIASSEYASLLTCVFAAALVECGAQATLASVHTVMNFEYKSLPVCPAQLVAQATRSDVSGEVLEEWATRLAAHRDAVPPA
jgi:hypothetical protein